MDRRAYHRTATEGALAAVLLWCLCFFVPSATADDAVLQAAVSALRRNDVGSALDQVQAYVAASPDDVEGHELLIDILLGIGLGQKAEGYYADRIANEPTNPDLHYLAGRAAVAAAPSEAAFREALRLDPSHPRAKMGLAAVYRASGKLEDAERLYEEALAKDPTLPEAWSGLVQVLLQLGRKVEAVEAARRSLAAVPDHPEPYLILASLRPLEAKDVLARGAAKVPDEPHIHIALARAYVEADDYPHAVSAYDAALRMADNDPNVRVERGVAADVAAGALRSDAGVVLLQVRAHKNATREESLRRLDAVVEENPRSVWARLARGNLLAEMAKNDLAQKDLEEAHRLQPKSADTLSSLGILYLAANRAAEAKDLLAEAARLRPKDPVLALAHAQAVTRAEGSAAGEVALRNAMGSYPFEGRIPVTLSQLLVEGGNLFGAYEVLESAASRSPTPDVLLAWVEVAQRLQRWRETVQILELLSATTGDARFAQRAEELKSSLQKASSP